MWQEGTGGKDFPVLHNSRNKYVERNNNSDDMHIAPNFCGLEYSFEVINHVIMAVLLEIRVFHLRLTLYHGIILPSVREQYYNRQDSVAGCWFVLFSMFFLVGARPLEAVRLGPMEQTQMQAGNTK